MPKQRITKEMVVDTAFELARREGVEKVTVKALAESLGCSVQPIYSYCQSMDGLRAELAERAAEFVRAYAAKAVDKNDLFRSTGRAYVRLAKEEPHIFKLFLFRERKNINSLHELYLSETDPAVAKLTAQKLGLSLEAAQELHLDMLIYTIGIGTIFAVTSPNLPEAEIFARQERAYEAFLKDAEEKTGNE